MTHTHTSTHTHTQDGGHKEKAKKLKIATQNMGGFGLEVRSNKHRKTLGPKMQYLKKCVGKNSTDILVLTETRIKTAAECKNI